MTSPDVDALNDLVVAITAAGFNASVGVQSHQYANRDVVIGLPTIAYQQTVCPSGRVHTTQVAVFARGQQPEQLLALLDDAVTVADAINTVKPGAVTSTDPATIDDTAAYVIEVERPI